MKRRKIIAGNWKMNKTPSQAVALVNELKPLVANDQVDVVFCVPAISIIPCIQAAEGSNIAIGAENMYFEEKGAFTGEIAPDMLTDAGVKYVIIGHSERREYFAETDETVNKKVLKALKKHRLPDRRRYPAERRAPARWQRTHCRHTESGSPPPSPAHTARRCTGGWHGTPPGPALP